MCIDRPPHDHAHSRPNPRQVALTDRPCTRRVPEPGSSCAPPQRACRRRTRSCRRSGHVRNRLREAARAVAGDRCMWDGDRDVRGGLAGQVTSACATYCAASSVVMCSNTIFSAGKSRRKGMSCVSMNTASRSNKSMSVLVTSPCTNSGMPARCMASNVAYVLRKSVTPASLLVVAPAG